ncbi:hypothetical protein WN51_14030 [Melipona quadrifasciata]|uniref:Uncharacterized protein n=1 Tax=Melipona quadrifasciata TaxID=166423 RepID=A0A0N0U509_9HYME|nr:hypothetical protein WN51_14030 [Melipona quadrifasciata]
MNTNATAAMDARFRSATFYYHARAHLVSSTLQRNRTLQCSKCTKVTSGVYDDSLFFSTAKSASTSTSGHSNDENKRRQRLSSCFRVQVSSARHGEESEQRRRERESLYASRATEIYNAGGVLEIPIGYAIRDAHLGLRPEKMIFLWMPGAVVRYLYPTHLLPRHTSFIMTVIIDYAPTSASSSFFSSSPHPTSPHLLVPHLQPFSCPLSPSASQFPVPTLPAFHCNVVALRFFVSFSFSSRVFFCVLGNRERSRPYRTELENAGGLWFRGFKGIQAGKAEVIGGCGVVWFSSKIGVNEIGELPWLDLANKNHKVETSVYQANHRICRIQADGSNINQPDSMIAQGLTNQGSSDGGLDLTSDTPYSYTRRGNVDLEPRGGLVALEPQDFIFNQPNSRPRVPRIARLVHRSVGLSTSLDTGAGFPISIRRTSEVVRSSVAGFTSVKPARARLAERGLDVQDRRPYQRHMA